MLNEIRGMADSFLIKALLWIVALSFIIWGVQEASKGFFSNEVVKFSDAQSITADEFLDEKDREIKHQEQVLGHTLDETDIKNMDLDKLVLHKMIKDNITDYIADYYKLNISDELVIIKIRNSKVFKNDNLEFDTNLFNSTFKTNYQKEQYLNSIRRDILKNAILSIFLDSFHIPKMLQDNISNYVHENRKLDVISFDLTSNNKEFHAEIPSQSQLEEFYNSHIDLFTIPEKRSFTYINVAYSTLLKKIILNANEIKDYYNENKEEFGNKPFSEVKVEVEEKLKEQKLEAPVVELIKKLEEEVAEGVNLQEIAARHNLTLYSANDKSYQDIKQDVEIKEASDIIYEMTEQEVAYPIDDRETKKIMLFELSKITPSNIESFETVKSKVTKLLQENALIVHNLKAYNQFVIGYKPGNNTKLPVGYKLDNNIELSRGTAFTNNKLPRELIKNIFETKLNENTPIVRVGNIVYFANIKSVLHNKNNDNESDEIITNNVKNIMVQELIDYFIKENNVKITYKEPKRQEP